MLNYTMDENEKACEEPDILRWAKWFEQADRHTDMTNVGEVMISTVFLGMDHGFACDGSAPVLWETLVFGGPLDGEMERYTSLEDAKQGHQVMVKRVEENPE